MSAAPTAREAYRHWQRDVIRYGDLDPQGHVNNAAFATFLESGRVAFFRDHLRPLMAPSDMIVLVRLAIDFRHEMLFPGEVEVGTRLAQLGSRSLGFAQALFSAGRCCATAESVVVVMDPHTRRAKSLSDTARAALAALKDGDG